MYYVNINVSLTLVNIIGIDIGIIINVDTTAKIRKKYACKKYDIWIPATCSCENSKYLKSTIEDLVIMFDEIIHVVDSISRNVPKNVTCTVSTSVKSTASTDFRDKNVRYK